MNGGLIPPFIMPFDLTNPSVDIENINFQITDLPTGQLAEATIRGFDENGVANAGKILIDHDANGLPPKGCVGWFVDETPLENSEFGNLPTSCCGIRS